MAIDPSGNVWVSNMNQSSLTELSSSGAATSPSTGYTGGGIVRPSGVAIDTSGNVWVANAQCGGAYPQASYISISEFSGSGAAISPSTGYTGGGVNFPCAVAIDASGNVWVANDGNGWDGVPPSLSEFSSNGVAISPSTGYATGSWGEVTSPQGIAIDGSGNVWVARRAETVSELSNGGALIPPQGVYTGEVFMGYEGVGGIAIDGSGNVWLTNTYERSITEFVGLAAPVMTPLVNALKNNKLGQRP
jgi:sugar lactone lactonase YvrE